MHIAFKIISGLAKPGIEAFILIFIILKFSALFNHLEKSYRKQNNIRSFFAGYFLSCSGDGNEMRHLVSEKAIYFDIYSIPYPQSTQKNELTAYIWWASPEALNGLTDVVGGVARTVWCWGEQFEPGDMEPFT